MPWRQQSKKNAILNIKVTVKVTASMTLMSIEWALLVEYAWQMLSPYLLEFKSYSEG